jgi:hypothetical protein
MPREAFEALLNGADIDGEWQTLVRSPPLDGCQSRGELRRTSAFGRRHDARALLRAPPSAMELGLNRPYERRVRGTQLVLRARRHRGLRHEHDPAIRVDYDGRRDPRLDPR